MKAIFLIVTVFYLLSGHTQTTYSKVKIFATDSQLISLENIGISVDHGSRKKNTWLVTDLSNQQIESLTNNGFQFEVLIADVQNYYINRSHKLSSSEYDRDDCPTTNKTYSPTTPSNFQLGSYAGFFTYQEFLNELDSMVSKYPNLMTTRQPIDTFLTHEGRPIYWVKISDNPTIDETEPEVLYTAIHHAREPASLSQLVFYMWYLLENYSNPEITHLINETELYFIPMINPDGYLENETSFPNGGGLHRKNKRSVGSTNPGVDLNRNYDYQWNVSGTSPNPNNDTYAGPSAFSEPETKAVEFFCQNHNFLFAMNAHSFGNLLIFPFGYANNVFTNDHQYFQTFSNHQVIFNTYNATKSSNLYLASGDSNDWMYDGDLTNKPKIFALTPEVGNSNDGFWPVIDRILPICKENVWPNVIAGHLPHIYGITTDQNTNEIETNTGYFKYNYQRLGLSSGPVNVSIQPLQNVASVGVANTHNLNLMAVVTDSIVFTLSPNLVFGDEIMFVINTDFGNWSRRDTVTKTFGNGLAAFNDNANSLSNWSGSWSLTNSYFVTPNTSITDSPNSNYGNNEVNSIILNQSLNFSQSTYAKAKFFARWEIENDFDYVQFMVSSDNGNTWIPQCGNYTNKGTSDQDEDEPLYDNFQIDWVLEEVDLSNFLGMSNIQFKFELVSDNFVTEDGFAFDDFKIIADGQDLSNAKDFINQFNIFPNPAADYIIIKDYETLADVIIYDQLGQFVLNPTITDGRLDVSTLSNGIYFIEMIPYYSTSSTQRITISK